MAVYILLRVHRLLRQLWSDFENTIFSFERVHNCGGLSVTKSDSDEGIPRILRKYSFNVLFCNFSD